MTGVIAMLVVFALVLIVLSGTVWSWVVLFWVAVFGTIAALIAPRKGYPPTHAFIVGAIFGIFGVAYLATREDVA